MPSQNFGTRKLFVIGMIVLVVAGLIGFFVIKGLTPSADNPTPSLKNLFPFGNSNPSGLVQSSPTTSGTTPLTQSPDTTNPLTTTSGERLRRITSYPITGFLPFSQPKTVFEPKFNEKTQKTELKPLTTTANIVRFNNKQTGEIIDADVTRDTIIVSTKALADIQKAEELWLGAQGNPLIFRTWNKNNNTIATIVGSMPQATSLAFCATPLSKNISQGSKGADVKQLQQYLENKLATRVTADGSFGKKTSLLVKNVQKMLSVPNTGIVDDVTREAINADCSKMLADASAAKPQSLQSSFLNGNILRGSMSPDGTKMFFLRSTNAGVAGIIANSDGSGQKQVFSSPFTEWMPQWISPTFIAMTTLASESADGYLYFLNPTTGEFRKVLGPIRGLTTLVSPDGKKVVYSNSTDQGFTTKLLTVSTGQTKNVDLLTLPAKCTWKDAAILICGVPRTIPAAKYPDAWYQDTTSFQDVLWSIDTTKGSTSVLLSPKDSFDVIRPSLSPDKSFLYFIDKTQGTLWSYRLSE